MEQRKCCVNGEFTIQTFVRAYVSCICMHAQTCVSPIISHKVYRRVYLLTRMFMLINQQKHGA